MYLKKKTCISLLLLYKFFPAMHNYRPQQSWGKVIFSEACVNNSVHRGDGLPQCMLGYQTPPPRSKHPLPGNRHPLFTVHAGRYGQQVGGMHPTGMHTFYRPQTKFGAR